MRAIAVAGVCAYHLGYLRGGYLGVDAFFVLSGYLITSLLVAEHARSGRISLRSFWMRRARRLLPALVLLLIGISVYAVTLASASERSSLRGESLSALFYVANWYHVIDGVSYWDLFRAPSPLTHLWSLAIEEQFYLVWPLVAALALRRSPRWLLGFAACGAVVSALWAISLYDPRNDTTRVYEGTDTRAAAILIGAVLALLLVRRSPDARRPSHIQIPLCAISLAGLGWAWISLSGASPVLYRGGLVACGLAVAVVLWVLVERPRCALARVIGCAPLRGLGLISYGVYLWHWPAIVVLTPTRVGLEGAPLAAVRVGATLAAALASYWLVERPIRSGRWAAPSRSRSLEPPRLTLAGGYGAVAVVLVAATASSWSPVASVGAARVVATGPIPVQALQPTPAPANDATGTTSATAPAASTAPATPAAPLNRRVLVEGDSGAWFLGQGMARVQGELAIEVTVKGRWACGIARGTGKMRLGNGTVLADPPDCHTWPTRFADDVREHAPAAALLVVAWPGIGDREVDGQWSRPCQTRFDAWYTGEVRVALRALQAPDTKAVMVLPAYADRDDLPGDHAKRIDCLHSVYRAVAAEVGAAVIDTNHLVCPDGQCLRTVDGVALRPDGLHFEGAGAELAARWFVNQMRSSGVLR